jgi:hypothetical protein
MARRLASAGIALAQMGVTRLIAPTAAPRAVAR